LYDGDRISAEDSWIHFTGTLNHESMGVLAVSVGECGTLCLPVLADPEPFPERVVLSFDDLSNAAIHARAKRLTQVAMARGWPFRSIAA